MKQSTIDKLVEAGLIVIYDEDKHSLIGDGSHWSVEHEHDIDAHELKRKHVEIIAKALDGFDLTMNDKFPKWEGINLKVCWHQDFKYFGIAATKYVDNYWTEPLSFYNNIEAHLYKHNLDFG